MPKLKLIIPEKFFCPITHELFSDPVVTSDGQLYERKAIEKWLTAHDTSPLTNLKLDNKKLVPVPFFKNEMTAFYKTYQLCTETEFFEKTQNAIQGYCSFYEIQQLNYLENYLSAQDYAKQTLLHRAALFDKYNIAVWLLVEGADPNSSDYQGMTPLHLARSAEMARLLLANQAKLEATNQRGETPLHRAAAYGCADVVKFLLEDKEANVLAQDNQDRTPEMLHEDVASTYIDSLGNVSAPGDYNKTKYYLLKHNPDGKEEYGGTFIHLAIQYQQLDVIRTLLYLSSNHACEPIDLEEKNKAGWTPLGLAAAKGFVEAVKELIKERANVNTKSDCFGITRTPLHHAAFHGHEEIVRLLLEQGADATLTDENQATPLQLAEKYNKVAVIKVLQLYEAPQKLAKLEQTVTQQQNLIHQMHLQLRELTQQIQQLTVSAQKSNADDANTYPINSLFAHKK